MPETINASVGEITVKWERLGDDENTIALKTPQGETFQWSERPPTFSDLTIADFNEQDAARLKAEAEDDEIRYSKVEDALLDEPNRDYENHPFVERRIEHSKQTINVLRSAGVPWSAPRIQKALAHILKAAGREHRCAAKKPYSNDAVVARKESELVKAVTPIYTEWREALNSRCPVAEEHRRREKRKEFVIAKFIPSGYNNTAFAPNYDATLKEWIERWIEVFEANRDALKDDENQTFTKIIEARLKEEFPRLSLANIRRGRQQIEHERSEPPAGCPSCGSDSNLHHNKDCRAEASREASWHKEQAEYDRRMGKKP